MKCPHCGAECLEQEAVCPVCGKTVSAPDKAITKEAGAFAADSEAGETAAEMAENALEQSVEQAMAQAEPEAPVSHPAPYVTEAPEKLRQLPPLPPVKNGHKETGRTVLMLALILASLALLVFGLIRLSRPGTVAPVTADPSQIEMVEASGTLQPVSMVARNTGAAGSAVPGAGNIVAECGGMELTCQEYIYYYWDSFYSLYGNYGNYLASYLDFETPFDQQSAADGQTWNDYFAHMAVDTWFQTETLKRAAKAENHVLAPEEQDYLNNARTMLEAYASSGGYASADAYLQTIFDPSSDLESYLSYMESTLIARSYTSAAYDRIAEDVYDPAAQVGYCVNVRHILIKPEAGTDIPDDASAKARAEELYALWLQDPTVEHFAQLAEEHTDDLPSASSGGLYQDIYPGQMVTAFNDWCFDESRQVGDSGIVQTDFGYHIMYFDSVSETAYNDPNAESAESSYNLWLDDLFASADYAFHPENVIFTQKPVEE
ncbi:MAG: peptidylprolyl isomerase [Clostridia bacterium]|nr:peptidylprolyl isomerase [Clostridia bacterium]